MIDPKYIVYEAWSQESVVIFDPTMVHKTVAEALLPGYKIISAGNCRIDRSGVYPEVSVYGESVTLRTSSRSLKDVDLIAKFLFKGDI